MGTDPELIAAAKDCADDLAARIEHEFNEIGRHPAMQSRYDRDMDSVLRLRAAIVKAEAVGEPRSVRG
jgi:hypothetical protein